MSQRSRHACSAGAKSVAARSSPAFTRGKRLRIEASSRMSAMRDSMRARARALRVSGQKARAVEPLVDILDDGVALGEDERTVHERRHRGRRHNAHGRRSER